jgi:hypothetical protein
MMHKKLKIDVEESSYCMQKDADQRSGGGNGVLMLWNIGV